MGLTRAPANGRDAVKSVFVLFFSENENKRSKILFCFHKKVKEMQSKKRLITGYCFRYPLADLGIKRHLFSPFGMAALSRDVVLRGERGEEERERRRETKRGG